MGIGKHLKVMLYNLHDQKVVRDLQLFFLRARITQMVEDGASDEELAESEQAVIAKLKSIGTV